MLHRIAFLLFVLSAVIAVVPPWFIDFKAVDPKYSALHAVALLLAVGACLILCRQADRERLKASKKEVHREADV